jgi:hypothetical protein
MFCHTCGKKAGDGHTFCNHCGTELRKAQGTARQQEAPGEEKKLLTFGPFGVAVTFGRPSISAWSYSNITTVEVTDRKIVGIVDRKMFPLSTIVGALFSSGSHGTHNYRFIIPYETLVTVESSTFLINQVLYLAYKEGDKVKEVSLYGLNGGIAEAFRLISSRWKK